MALKIEDQTYADVRGFNYQPSYASYGGDIWGEKFDPEAINLEISRARKHFPKTNTMRLWFSHEAWMIHGDAVFDRFDKAIDICDDYGYRVMAMIFNGWHSIPPYGGFTVEQLIWVKPAGYDEVYTPYLDEIIKRHRDDERIMMWDIANEPTNSCGNDHHWDIVVGFMKHMGDRIRELNATQPITIGMPGVAKFLRPMEPICDVLSVHPYFVGNDWVPTPEMFGQRLDELVAIANENGKPMLASECCWGSFDDAERGRLLSDELPAMAERGFGIIPHLLHETLVADGHRPDLGPIVPDGAGYMAFINRDGQIRDHHEIFNDY